MNHGLQYSIALLLLAEYVEQVMKLAYPVAEGVHIYRHQNKLDPKEREKYDVIQRVMSSWTELPAR